VSRFKHRKFDVTCDSNGTNCWVPVEQAKALLCDAMQLESDYASLKAEVERLNDLANDPYRLSKGWRPIETAPMDGTDILCFCVEPEFEGEENPWTEFRVCFYGVLTEGESCWMSHYGYEQHPTHWMPLPNPPAAKEGRDAK
jgi:hypothetical protein